MAAVPQASQLPLTPRPLFGCHRADRPFAGMRKHAPSFSQTRNLPGNEAALPQSLRSRSPYRQKPAFARSISDQEQPTALNRFSPAPRFPALPQRYCRCMGHPRSESTLRGFLRQRARCVNVPRRIATPLRGRCIRPDAVKQCFFRHDDRGVGQSNFGRPRTPEHRSAFNPGNSRNRSLRPNTSAIRAIAASLNMIAGKR